MDKYYILAADDDPLNLIILEELLATDYDLACVSSAAACIKSVKKRKPDLILMDVSMPEKNGLQACYEIKNTEGLKQIPVVMLSALASEAEIEMGIESGADSYICKPFNESDIKNAIDSLLA